VSSSSIAAVAAATCRTHPATTVSTFCSSCVGPYCGVCLFATPQGPLCPECALRPSRQGRGSALLRSVLSLCCAIVGTLVLFCMLLFQALSGKELPEAGATLLGFLALISSVGGLSLGLIARDHAQGQRSPLALVGLIANGVLLGAFVLLSIVGIAMGNG
jgi:tellurite resistance protein TehA-like permease